VGEPGGRDLVVRLGVVGERTWLSGYCKLGSGGTISEESSPMNKGKLLKKLLSGSKNVRFSELVACAEAFGFSLDRISGSHYIYTHSAIPELLNLQNFKGQAKPYQVKQFLELVETYDLELGEQK
jgi:hypothetical protein